VILEGKENKDFSMTLLPHQNAFLDTFFSPSSKRIIELEGNVGIGKSTALVFLAARLLNERSSSRILLLAPKALCPYFREMMGRLNTPVVIVDRYRFREMLDSAKGVEIWPQGAVFILSLDFAKLPDIRDSLAETTWDVVIVDEAHHMSGTKAEALRMIEPRAKKIVLAIATSQGFDTSKILPENDKVIIKWSREQVVDHNGKPFNVAPRPILHEIDFRLSAGELNLRENMDSLCKTLESYEGNQKFGAKSLYLSLESSPAAHEAALEKFTVKLEELGKLDAYMESTDIDKRKDFWQKIGEISSRVLQGIDTTLEDSKLNAFIKLLIDIYRGKTPERKVCVLTQYLATLYYLAADLGDHGMACQLLHGGMSLEDRLRSLSNFLATEKILVATTSILSEGLDLNQVTDLILYDMPNSKDEFRQILGRFDRFGRECNLNIHVLTCSTISAEDSLALPIATLRELVSL